jgi:hypothetical protein
MPVIEQLFLYPTFSDEIMLHRNRSLGNDELSNWTGEFGPPGIAVIGIRTPVTSPNC